MTTAAAGHETAGRGAGVTGVPATGRGASVDVAGCVFTPADGVLTDRAPAGALTTERDADGTAAAGVAGRLTREGSPPAAGFPACFSALLRAS